MSEIPKMKWYEFLLGDAETGRASGKKLMMYVWCAGTLAILLAAVFGQMEVDNAIKLLGFSGAAVGGYAAGSANKKPK